MNTASRSRFTLRRPAAALLIAVAFAAGGCGWWDKNVSGRMKKVTDRRLTITTNPPGADVFVNDVFQGKSPVSLNYKFAVKDVFKGFIIVVQKKGYLPVRREASFRDETISFRLIRKGRKRRRRLPPGFQVPPSSGGGR